MCEQDEQDEHDEPKKHNEQWAMSTMSMLGTMSFEFISM